MPGKSCIFRHTPGTPETAAPACIILRLCGQNMFIISERMQRVMDEQTRKLLEECTIGCQMAADSLQQIRGYIKDSGLQELTDQYTKRHEKLRQEADECLAQNGYEPKEPGTVS